MSSSDWRRHTHQVAVGPGDIDHMGHVNNAVYLRWVQEATIAHWAAIARAERVGKLLWIALKHEIVYRKPSFLGEEVIVETALGQVNGAKASFVAIVRRGGDLLAEVRSLWCAVDAGSHRPRRIAQILTELATLG